jgi:hypothetical protein
VAATDRKKFLWAAEGGKAGKGKKKVRRRMPAPDPHASSSRPNPRNGSTPSRQMQGKFWRGLGRGGIWGRAAVLAGRRALCNAAGLCGAGGRAATGTRAAMTDASDTAKDRQQRSCCRRRPPWAITHTDLLISCSRCHLLARHAKRSSTPVKSRSSSLSLRQCLSTRAQNPVPRCPAARSAG